MIHVWHSDSFDRARVGGTRYRFTPLQAAVVRLLWEAHEAGTDPVPQDEILRAAGSDQLRLDHLFRRGWRVHPAWGALIVRAGPGYYRLQLPRPASAEG